MSITAEISRIQTAKSSIITSIENKGVTVPIDTKLDGIPALIDSIPTGSGSDLPENYAVIGGKIYRTITKNDLVFVAQNIEFVWDELIIKSEISDNPRAAYWSNNKDANGLKGSQWGLYYNYAAAKYLYEHPELLNGFRVATEEDYIQLFSTEDVNNFKAVSTWNTNPGNDIENFTLFASGFWESGFSGNGTDCYIRCGESNKNFHLNRDDTSINFTSTSYTTSLFPIRLCKNL